MKDMINRLKLSALLLALSLMSIGQSITVDTRYFTSPSRTGYELGNSSRALGLYTNEVLQWHGIGWSALSSEKPFLFNIPYFFLSFFTARTLGRQATTAQLHEFGHARAEHAVGFVERYFFDASGDGVITYETSNFFLGHFYQLRHFGFNGASAGNDGSGNRFSIGTLQDKYFSDDYNGGVSDVFGVIQGAGGLNIELFRAKLDADLIYLNGGFMQNWYIYMDNKASWALTPEYPEEGDAAAILQSFESLGLNVRDKDMVGASWRSLFLSGGTYSYLYGMYNYFKNGDSRVRPLMFGRFMLPEVSGYINPDGLSHKISTWVTMTDKWSLHPAYEFVYTGNERSEFSIGSLTRGWLMDNLKTYAWINIGKGMDAMVEGSYMIKGRFQIGIGIDLYDDSNLYGERHIPTLENGKRFAQTWLSIAYVFKKIQDRYNLGNGIAWQLLKSKKNET